MSISNSYLWLRTGNSKKRQITGLINNRYSLVGKQICLDTQPEQILLLETKIPKNIFPYFHLFNYQLHLPIVYDFFSWEGRDFLILENVPINENGELYPSLKDAWSRADSLQKLYWLWQILELWQPLKQENVAQSLLSLENIRVDGWRVRLLELLPDKKISLKDLGNCWHDLLNITQGSMSNKLKFIISELQSEGYSLAVIKEIFHELLSEQISDKPLRNKIFSITDKGNKRSHNEDHHYPTQLDLYVLPVNYNQNLANSLMIICDGMGGHEGGEVASYLAIESLKVQIKMFLLEMAKNCELLTPDMVKESLATIIRVANNVIYSRNEIEGKSDRQSMGTTLIMALHLPQWATTAPSREIYLANVGDSRAYWITLNQCQQLTIDDDWVTKSVRAGKSFYRQALQNPNYAKLTQALGIRDSSYLDINIQQLILVEDGILLLCSDGLSDYHFLENYWRDFMPDVLTNKTSLQTAIESLLKLAVEKNGHDNITIVATYYGISPQESVVVNLGDLETNNMLQDIPDASSLVLAASSIVTWDDDVIEGELEGEDTSESEDFDWGWWLSIAVAIVVGISSYMVTQWTLQSEFNPPLIKDVPMQQ